MADSTPPRVRVTLPGGRVVEGQMLGWRQDEDGKWVPRVTIDVPAAAVAPVAGEDYSSVPRVPAEPRFVVHRMAPLNGKPQRELHLSTCWLYPRDVFLIIRIDSAEEAVGLLREGVMACEICHPEERTGGER